MSSPKNDPDKAAKVFADDRANVFHSWSAQAQISPMAIAGGAGSYFWDFTGKKYLDFSYWSIRALSQFFVKSV